MSARIGVTAFALGMFACAPAIAQTDPQTSMQSGRSDNLSHQLSKTGGVIKPKGDVDPNMNAPAPAPHPNSTPVIPPSATGGNNAK
jgi:hypothetical protein